MCSSYSTTTQPAECACSSSSSLSASQFHGFMVRHTRVSVIFLSMDGTFLPFVADLLGAKISKSNI